MSIQPSDITSNREPLELDYSELDSPAEERSEEEILAEAIAEEEALKVEEEKRMSLLQDLAYAVEKKFGERETRRGVKEAQWLECWQLYLPNGVVSKSMTYPFNNAKDATSQHRPDVNIVANKCDIAIAQCESMQFSVGEKNWDLQPAANAPSEDATACELMEREIETQLDECRYAMNCRKAIKDRVIMGTGVLKGPVNTGKLKARYEPIGDGSTWAPKLSIETAPEITYVNPWFFYPDDTVNEFHFVGDSIELHPMSGLELKKLAEHPGYLADNIIEVLKTPPEEYTSTAYSEYASLTNTNPYLFQNKYKVLEYHGPVTTDQLGAIGIDPTYESVNGEYYGEVWVVAGKVIRLELSTIEGCFEIPYCLSTWIKDPSSVFGIGAPMLMRDQQRVVTNVWHMLLDNASVSSGPQVAMNKEFIEPADGSWVIDPHKIWYLKDPMMHVTDAIQFFEVPNVTEDLLPILEMARRFAEEESLTPAIAAGLNSPQPSESATGALLMYQNSTTLLDYLAEEWDDHVTDKVIRRMYGWNMQYNPKPEIKGDFSIDVRSSTEYKNKQIHLRDIERLSVEASQNPDLGMLINLEQLQRVRLTMMNIPYKGVVKSDEEVAAVKEQMANKPDPQMMELEIKKMELEVQKAKLAMEQQQLQFEATQQQQREMWDHEERMAAAQARLVEAQASVIKSQNEKDTAMMQLQGKLMIDSEKNRINLETATMSEETKVFLKSMEELRKREEMALTAQELKMKAKTGSGI